MTDQRAITRYLRRLDEALRKHGSDRRNEIVAEVEAHIREELAELDHEPTRIEIDEILGRVGDPKTIASQEAGEPPIYRRTKIPEIAALVLLVAGGFLHLPLGWLAGAGLLWLSSRWTTRQKILGTLLVPGGLMLPIYIWMNGCGTSNPVGDGNGPLPTRYVCDWFGMPREWMIGIVAGLALTALIIAGYLSSKIRRPGDSTYLSRSLLTSPFLVVLLIVGAIGWSATREELASGVGTEGPWRLVVSWEFTYCLKYQYSLGTQGACGMLPSHELSVGWSRRVLRVDDVYTVVAGEIPPGTESVEVILEDGSVVPATTERVLEMAFYAAQVEGRRINAVRALDDDGNVIEECNLALRRRRPGLRPSAECGRPTSG